MMTLATTSYAETAESPKSWAAGVAYHALVRELALALHEVATSSIPCDTRRELLYAILGAIPAAERDTHVHRVKRLGLAYHNDMLDHPGRATLPDHTELDAALHEAATALAHATADVVTAYRATAHDESAGTP